MKDDQNIIKETQNTIIEGQNELKNKIDDMSKIISKKFLDNDNFPSLEEIKNFLSDYMDYINSLSFTNQILIFNICGNLSLILILMSSLSIFFTNYLITKFDLSTKYPRIAKLLEYRRKFNLYYLYWNLFLSISILIIVLFINIMLLFY
nr:hypothetical protein [Grifola frondosa]